LFNADLQLNIFFTYVFWQDAVVNSMCHRLDMNSSPLSLHQREQKRKKEKGFLREALFVADA